jgi:hypothetical protein
MLPQDLEAYKADLAVWQAERIELAKSVILTAQNALKSAMLINGGAAVALLAFVGHVWKPDGSTLLISIAGALYWFVIGVLLDAVSAASFYFTQWFYHETSGASRDRYFVAGVTFHMLAILLVLTSYGTFAYGTLLVYNALIK